MIDDKGVRSDLDLLDHEAEDPLAIDDLQRLRRGVELRQKSFEALGEGDVGVGIQYFGLECREGGVHRRLSLTEWGTRAGARRGRSAAPGTLRGAA
jgi:hypothetical protein